VKTSRKAKPWLSGLANNQGSQGLQGKNSSNPLAENQEFIAQEYGFP